MPFSFIRELYNEKKIPTLSYMLSIVLPGPYLKLFTSFLILFCKIFNMFHILNMENLLVLLVPELKYLLQLVETEKKKISFSQWLFMIWKLKMFEIKNSHMLTLINRSAYATETLLFRFLKTHWHFLATVPDIKRSMNSEQELIYWLRASVLETNAHYSIPPPIFRNTRYWREIKIFQS